MTQPTEHFLAHQNIIHEAAWHRCKSNPSLEFNELVAEGNLAYMEALETWDPDKGRFSTHLTWRLKYRLSRANRKSIDRDTNTCCLDDGLQVPDPGTGSGLISALENLGAEAREVVGLILGSSGELADFTTNSVKVTITNLKLYLRSKGWTWRVIDGTMSEIKGMLREL